MKASRFSRTQADENLAVLRDDEVVVVALAVAAGGL